MDAARKHSHKRDAILSCLRSTIVHPTAEWVYRQLKPEIPDLSLGTVYRNLAMFKQTGEVQSLGTVDGLERFDADTAPHAHFICVRCNAVLDAPGIALPATVLNDVGAVTGGRVSGCQLLFFGECSDCLKEKEIKNFK